MASYEMKDRTTLKDQETGSGGGNRDDLQLQRLGKKPVLKVCEDSRNSNLDGLKNTPLLMIYHRLAEKLWNFVITRI